ncbi:hypothetical protein ACJ73_02546 [Blastomyces percursus]|uniref:DDE-1 domain-containing protein n=1 Tax=Blastomyces percursus TaxID=1658174 RepID=A0A1J9REK8_9EURO|nr:hypothetical protein ACJ73_02546 [Blastomyces percursus]
MIILKGKMHQSRWYETAGLPRDWVIGVSENDWTTDQLGLYWLKEVFNKETLPRTKGTHRLLILDWYRSHASAEFDQFSTENGIIALYMPPHSFHLLQPFDDSHPPGTSHSSQASWATSTPHNIRQLEQQDEKVKKCIKCRTQSPPSPTYQALSQLVKGCQMSMHRMALLEQEVKELSLCLILHFLALVLVDQVFETQGINLLKDILHIKLRWRSEMLIILVVHHTVYTTHRVCIAPDLALSYDAFNQYLQRLGRNAGLEDPLTPYYIRRGTAKTVDKLERPANAEHCLRTEIARQNQVSRPDLLKLALAERLFAQGRGDDLFRDGEDALAITRAKLFHINSDWEGVFQCWTEAMQAVDQFTLTKGHTTRTILLSICDILRRQGQHELELKSRDQLATLEKLAGTGGSLYWIAGLRHWLDHLLQTSNRPRI